MRRLLLALLCAAALAGCSGRYFRDAVGAAPEVRYALAGWPQPEQWAGVIFNGEKIGFTRLTLRPAPAAPGRFEIDSEAVITMRFLGVEKSIVLRALDRVREDLTLERFEYEYVMDGTAMRLRGEFEGGLLAVSAVTGGRPFEQEFRLDRPLYPSSAMALMPAFRGLLVGAEYVYTVYDGENQKLGEVTQKVEGWETSELFQGPAFKLSTLLHGLSTTTWMDSQARPVFELALNGVLISVLEDEASARRYLAAASLNKEEALVEFSRIRPDRPLERPREVSALQVEIRGLPQGTALASGAGQSCAQDDNATRCEIRRPRSDPPSVTGSRQEAGPTALRPSLNVQSNDPTIRALAARITATEASDLGRVRALVDWIQANIRREAVDVFSALDVLQSRRAECQGHAWLYAALARSVGIPTRVVSGLVYLEEFQGFLYHAWNESLVDGAWLPVDPTFGQVPADATHITMLEGDTLADLLPMVNWVGRLKISVGEAQYPQK
ncbi:MAG TPA: transglutaminase-like domain-containing protein [Burkholderiales bacterium]|nr:transglutaminase-like domain-containing protein [Burkholderiales bacterium]